MQKNNMKINYKIKSKRGKSKVELRKSKTVKISGKIQGECTKGTFVNRFGRQIYGIKVTYLKINKKGAGKDGRIKRMKITKIVPIPKKAYAIKVKV